MAALDGRYTAQTALQVHDAQDNASQRLALDADILLGVQLERLQQSVNKLEVGLLPGLRHTTDTSRGLC